ncbi:MAG: M28 family peptidase [Cyclobacteriaceae bacterium]
MRKFIYLSVAMVALAACTQTSEKQSITLDQALADVKVEEYKNHLAFLSSDELMGRFPGEPGYDTAAAYVERLVRKMGLQPGGLDGTYRQPIEFTKSILKPSTISVKLDGKELKHEEDFVMGAVTEDVSFSGQIVFVGAGIDAPDLGYSDLDGLDLEGKVAMYVWRTVPEKLGIIERAVSANLMKDKLIERGVVGMISVIPREAMSRLPWPLIKWLVSRPQMDYISDDPEPYRAGLAVSYKTAEAWFAKDGKKLPELIAQIKSGTPASYETSLSIEVQSSSEREQITSDNVAAILEGSDPELKDEYLVMTAHLDHDGISNPVEGDSIYNGTMDNASGSSALLVLADKLSQMKTKRSIMFLWVTAEERGLLGSEYFAKYPTISPEKIVANQNIDGISNLIAAAKDMIVFGYEYSNLAESADYSLAQLGLDRAEDPKPEETYFIRSDQYSFVKEGIPAVWISGGYTSLYDSIDALAVSDAWTAERYHKPSDDMNQPINFEAGMTEVKANLLIAHHIANELDSVQWDQDGFLYKTFKEGKE